MSLSLLPYTGSKRLDMKFFVDYLPLPESIDMIIEPFGGSGYTSLYYYSKIKEIKCHINDVDKMLITCFEQLKHDGERVITKLNKMITGFDKDIYKTYVDEFKNKTFKEKNTASLYLFINKVHGPRKFLFPTTTTTKEVNITKFEPYFKWLKNTKFTLNDYTILFDKYKDKKNCFVFLDPPYLSSFNAYYDGYAGYDCRDKDDKLISDNTKLFIDILDFIKVCKCKCMLIINKNAITEHLYKKYIVGEYDKMYQLTKKKTKHLIVCNYKN